MSGIHTTQGEAKSDGPMDSTSTQTVEDLVFENKTINALIKGLLEDIEIFKKANGGKGSAPDIVRFTMQLNILKDKEKRNLSAINDIVKQHASQKVEDPL